MDEQNYAMADQRARSPEEARTYSIQLVPLSIEDTFVPVRDSSIQVGSTWYVARQQGMTLPRTAILRMASLNECIHLARAAPGREVSSTPIPIPIPILI